MTHDLGRIDTISWTADWNTVSFTDPTQIPYNDVNSTILWAHTFSPTTTFTNSINFDWFSQDNAANSQRLLWRFTSGVQSQLTPRLTFNGQIGLIFANAYQNGNAQSTSVTYLTYFCARCHTIPTPDRGGSRVDRQCRFELPIAQGHERIVYRGASNHSHVYRPAAAELFTRH